MTAGRMFGIAFAGAFLWGLLLNIADYAGGTAAVLVVCALVLVALIAFVVFAMRAPVVRDSCPVELSEARSWAGVPPTVDELLNADSRRCRVCGRDWRRRRAEARWLKRQSEAA